MVQDKNASELLDAVNQLKDDTVMNLKGEEVDLGGIMSLGEARQQEEDLKN